MIWGNLTTAAIAVSAGALFLRWRIPAVPPFIASAGVGASLAIALLSFFQPTPVIAASLALNMALVVGIFDHSFVGRVPLRSAADNANLVLNFSGAGPPTEVSNQNVYSWYATSLLLTAVGENGEKQHHVFNQWVTAIWFANDLFDYQVLVEALSGEAIVSTVAWRLYQ